uniref:CLIP domain-containing serine protease n=1 Tax=Glossina morsitans morsitans TaxID=37546 RepID=A0A1B0FFU3_GLOMM
MKKLALLLVISYIYVWEIPNCSVAQIVYPGEESDASYVTRCTTPNRERALCINLEDCQYLYNVLITVPLKDSDRLYLSRSQCGYRNGKVLICCPERHRQKLPTATPPITSPVSNLLPDTSQCGNVLSNRIYGGNKTDIDEFPWMALIEYTKGNSDKGHHCGGTLISDRYVITASHCVNGPSIPTDWRLTGVRLGEWDTTTNPDCEVDIRGNKDCAPEHLDVAVESAIPHPMYAPNSRNQLHDIALLRLARRVTFTDFVRPVCLPLDDNLRTASFDGIVMDVAGWGKTESGSSSTVKLKAPVQGLEPEECRRIYSRQNIHLGDKQICAGGKEGVDSCRGDSGGPLITLNKSSRIRSNYFLAGIVSFGPTPCGLEGWPGIYTWVGKYIEWIIQTMKP